MRRILGLDYGTKTVGVALSDELHITAQPLETITRKDANKLRKTYARIEELVKEYMYTGNTKRLLYESEEIEPDRKFQIIRNVNNKDKAKRKRKGA